MTPLKTVSQNTLLLFEIDIVEYFFPAKGKCLIQKTGTVIGFFATNGPETIQNYKIRSQFLLMGPQRLMHTAVRVKPTIGTPVR